MLTIWAKHLLFTCCSWLQNLEGVLLAESLRRGPSLPGPFLSCHSEPLLEELGGVL